MNPIKTFVNICRFPVRSSMLALALSMLLSVLPASTAASNQESIGTLFFSPDERSAIVAARKAGEPGAFKGGGNDSTSVSVSGLVKRGRSKSTAWINGRTVAEGQAVPAAGVPVISAKSVIIDGQSVRVRETLDLESGARSDVLPQGAVSVRPHK